MHMSAVYFANFGISSNVQNSNAYGSRVYFLLEQCRHIRKWCMYIQTDFIIVDDYSCWQCSSQMLWVVGEKFFPSDCVPWPFGNTEKALPQCGEVYTTSIPVSDPSTLPSTPVKSTIKFSNAHLTAENVTITICTNFCLKTYILWCERKGSLHTPIS